MTDLTLRALTAAERDQAYLLNYRSVDLRPYQAEIRRMQKGTAYAVPVNGALTRRAIAYRFNAAASQLGVKLRWAKLPVTTPELVVELDG